MKLLHAFCAPAVVPLLMLFSQGGSSFSVYSVQKSLTPLGWTLLVLLPLVLLLGAVFLARIFSKKSKLK